MSNDRDSLRPSKLVTYMDGGMPTDRVVTRTQGCWNCLHRASQEEVAAKYRAMTGFIPGHEKVALLNDAANRSRKFRRAFYAELESVKRRNPMWSESACIDHILQKKVEREGRSGIIALGAWIKDEKITYCRVDATTTPGAFVPIAYLCGDSNGVPCKWEGTAGADEARGPGRPTDKPLDEVYDDVESKAKKRKLTVVK